MSYEVMVLILVALNGIIIKEIGYFAFGSKQPNEILQFLEKNMPMLIMIILVCFLYKGLNYKDFPYALDYILAGVSTLIFYLLFKKSFVAIILATVIFYILHDVVL